MGFRTLEISQAAEIHIKEGQLEVSTEENSVLIPIEDFSQIVRWWIWWHKSECFDSY